MSETAPKPQTASYERDKVVEIISSVISKVEQVEHAQQKAIFDELNNLQAIINEARMELGAARPGDIKEKHIPTATDELDAVVEATAEASGTIMDCADIIQEKAGEVGGDAGAAIADQCMKIYEACSFQDITGQRITKVVSTLKTIDAKVEQLLSTLGEKAPGMDSETAAAAAAQENLGKTRHEKLLNGPQSADAAITQDDIDKLLSEFD